MTQKISFVLSAFAVAACASPPAGSSSPPLPPAGSAASPRHGEWTMVRTPRGDSVRAWLVFPERATRAPVIVIVHEIYGLTPWLRGVADQFAAAGFIAIAPDLLTRKQIAGSPEAPDPQASVAATRALRPDDVHADLRAVAQFAMALPAAKPRYGIVGFCWDGGTTFQHAIREPSLGAAVVYYGPSPAVASLVTIRAPVLGLYGGDDTRITATVAAIDSAMKGLGKTYTPIVFAGAGHGFLRELSARGGANRAAAERAWPTTIAWFRKYLEG